MAISKVFLIDPHPIFRAGTRAILSQETGFECIGEAADAATAISTFSKRAPDLVLTELVLPDSSATQLISRTRQMLPACRFIVLTSHEGATHVTHLLRAGASAFLLKSSPASELTSALKSVENGGVFVDSNVTRSLVEQSRRTRNGQPLLGQPDPSQRELEILRLTALGHGNKEIAAMLRLSIKTVETHKCRGMKKLGFQGRADVVHYAVQCGWLPTGQVAAV